MRIACTLLPLVLTVALLPAALEPTPGAAPELPPPATRSIDLEAAPARVEERSTPRTAPPRRTVERSTPAPPPPPAPAPTVDWPAGDEDRLSLAVRVDRLLRRIEAADPAERGALLAFAIDQLASETAELRLGALAEVVLELSSDPIPGPLRDRLAGWVGTHPSPAVRSIALWITARDGTDAGRRSILMACLETDPSPFVRETAAEGLVRFLTGPLPRSDASRLAALRRRERDRAVRRWLERPELTGPGS